MTRRDQPKATFHKTCIGCGEAFSATRSVWMVAAQGEPKYCGRACYGSHVSAAIRAERGAS